MRCRAALASSFPMSFEKGIDFLFGLGVDFFGSLGGVYDDKAFGLFFGDLFEGFADLLMEFERFRFDPVFV